LFSFFTQIILFPISSFCCFQLSAEHKRLLNDLQTVSAQGRSQIDTLVSAVQQLEQSGGALGDAWRASETRQWFDATFQR
jgi:hypothetical protein